MYQQLPTRKNNRLKYYSYSNQGMYFITICTKDKKKILGNIEKENTINLTKEGRIIERYIKSIEKNYEAIQIDDYVIMPNHIHILLLIQDNTNKTISVIIKQFKECVTKELGYKIWQRSFHDHVVRNEKEHLSIKQYIQNNIINWQTDCYF